MIGADAEGADLESRAASWGGVVSQYTGNAAVMHPSSEPSQGGQLSVPERTGPLEDHAVHVPADAGAVRRGLLRHLLVHVLHPASGTFRSRLRSPGRRGSGYADVYLHVQGPCR